MDSIVIWADRPRGRNLITHFWFKQTDSGIPHRVCDGTPWIERQEADNEPAPFVPCHLCKEIYLADVLHGRKILTISPEPPSLGSGVKAHGIGLYTHENWVNTPRTMVYSSENGGLPPLKEEIVMPRVLMSGFAKFCEARPHNQVRIVQEIRTQQVSADHYMRRDFYGPLKQLLRTTHWATTDVGTFENALAPFLDKQKQASKREHYRILGETYIDFWKNKEATHFQIRPVDIGIAGLTIGVNPEVGMRTSDGDYQALKLWFNTISPTRQTRQIIVHLMDRANNDAQWHSGIWDIRKRNIPLPVRTSKDFELGLIGQAAAFLKIWEDLDQEAQRVNSGG